jgi:hypothetical protein
MRFDGRIEIRFFNRLFFGSFGDESFPFVAIIKGPRRKVTIILRLFNPEPHLA